MKSLEKNETPKATKKDDTKIKEVPETSDLKSIVTRLNKLEEDMKAIRKMVDKKTDKRSTNERSKSPVEESEPLKYEESVIQNLESFICGGIQGYDVKRRGRRRMNLMKQDGVLVIEAQILDISVLPFINLLTGNYQRSSHENEIRHVV
ncbi:uncharacterized protein LOC114336352 [Diabrotica virgifera virgifera]|uniref:Uncharacterized protein LOC114336352 n=1 Tax=Diabrotica virgifera virgifera TaxID=50390 RepID=A0A6P7G0T7_DIAVI|nr:uncharacterized protein LOC114336352 [Diabrotica virgifera virgifera]